MEATSAFAIASCVPWMAACSKKETPEPSAVRTQQPESTKSAPRPKVVALLREGKTPSGPSPDIAAEMQRLGWIEGKTHVFERRGYKTAEELPAVVSEMVALKPDVIIVENTIAARVARQATTTIPIIFNVASDPVESGLVTSLARPGGNVTGFYWGVNDEKRLQLVKDLVPRARDVAYMGGAAGLAEKGGSIGLHVRNVAAGGEKDLDRFIAQLRSLHCDAVVVSQLDWVQRDWVFKRLAEDFIAMRMPSVGPGRLFVASGGLAAYQPVLSPVRIVGKADEILHGANPGDIPVEMPTHYRLLINAGTAKAIGLTIPKPVRQIADEIIS